MADQVPFDPYFVHGLRPHPNIPRNAPYMDKYTGLMACERRAKELPTFTWPVGFPAVGESWPPMEGYHGDRVALGVVGGVFHTLSPSALTSSALTLYSATAPASTYTISGSGSWHFAAFLDMWFATNGTSLVYKIPSTADNKVVGHHSAFSCQTVCNWNNRLVLGGMSGSRFSSSAWGRFFDLWTKRNKKNVLTSEDDTFDTTWIILGPPVGGDSGIPNASLMALLGLPSDTVYETVFEAKVIEYAENGMIDLLPVRHSGPIQRAEVQGGDLLIYGTEGVSRIRESEIGPIEVQASPVGIWGRASAGGTKDEIVSIGTDGNAYMAGSGAMRYAVDGYYQPEQVGPDFYRLGWTEYLSVLNSGTLADFVYVVYDPTEQRYWFSHSTDAFLLSKTGLCHSPGVIPSVAFRFPGSKALLGVSIASETNPMGVAIRTVPFDAGRRDPFNVGRIDTTTTDTATDPADRLKVTPLAKLKKQDTMRTFPAVIVDIRGTASVDMLGVEHQYEWTAADRTKVDIDGAIAFIDPPDKSPSLRKWLTVESL